MSLGRAAKDAVYRAMGKLKFVSNRRKAEQEAKTSQKGIDFIKSARKLGMSTQKEGDEIIAYPKGMPKRKK